MVLPFLPEDGICHQTKTEIRQGKFEFNVCLDLPGPGILMEKIYKGQFTPFSCKSLKIRCFITLNYTPNSATVPSPNQTIGTFVDNIVLHYGRAPSKYKSLPLDN